MLFLDKFVISTELVSFNTVKQFCTDTLGIYDSFHDYKSQLEDLEAILSVAHATNRLDEDIESVGSIDLYHLIHESKDIYYHFIRSSVLGLSNEDLIQVLMKEAIESIISYCNKTLIAYSVK